MISWLFFSLTLSTANFVIHVQKEQGSVPRQVVEVFKFESGEVFREPATVTTGSNGRARVSLRASPSASFVARTTYEGVTYLSDPFLATAKETTLKVFSATEDPSGVRVADLRFSISHEGTSLLVEQEILIQNSQTATFVGRTNKNRQQETFKLSLPSKAFNLRLQQGFVENATHFEGNEMVVSTPLFPGFNRFRLEYEIDRPFLRYSLGQRISLPVDQISIGSPLSIAGRDLTKTGTKWVGESLWTLYAGNPGQIDFVVSGIPVRFRLAHILPILTVLAGLLALLVFYRSNASRSTSAPTHLLIQELVYLKRIRDEKILSEADFERERLRLLTELEASYLNQNEKKPHNRES